MGISKFIVFLIVLLNITFITSQTNYKTLTLNEVYHDSVTNTQTIQYSLSYYEYDDELITVTLLQLTSSNTVGNITFCVGYIEDDHIITIPTTPSSNSTTDSSSNSTTPSSNSTSTPSSSNSTDTSTPSSNSTTPSSTDNSNTTTPITTPVDNTNTTTENNNNNSTEESIYDVYVCSVPGQQTLILPHLPHSHLRSENITLYINVTTTSNTTDSFTISASPILEALSDANKVAENRYIITGSIKSGLRQYYHYHPSTTSQTLQIESCGSEDLSGNHNPIWGAFLFNRTNDHWQTQIENYNQSLVDHPCGLQNNGNSVSFYPQANQSNSYLFICPSYVVTSGPFDDHSYFAIDILLYRFLQKNGTLNYRVVIDTNSSISSPLTPALRGNPSQIYNANFTISKSELDAVVSFNQITAADGSLLPDIQYALFSDFTYSPQEVQYLKANTSMASSCYLLNHQEKMIISSWFPNNQLTLVENSTRASFVVKDFYTAYDNRTFEVNLVGYSYSKGSFAYTYQTIDTTIHYNLPIGMSVLIVIGSIVATIAVFLVLGVIGYFAYIKYQNRSKYELL